MNPPSLRTDTYGHRYLGIEQLAQLPTDHSCWQALRRVPSGWREQIPVFDPEDCRDLAKEGFRLALQCSPDLSYVVGMAIVILEVYDRKGLLVPIVLSPGMSLRRTHASTCSASQQQDLLMQFLLDDLWQHDWVFGDAGIDLPDGIYQTSYQPPLAAMAGRYERPVHDYVLWFDRATKKLTRYRYHQGHECFVAERSV